MRVDVEKIFIQFLEECGRMDFQGRWSEKQLDLDWYVLEVYLEHPQAVIHDVIQEIIDRVGDNSYKPVPEWLKVNGLYKTRDRVQWVESLREIVAHLITLISGKQTPDPVKTLQDFYEFCHRYYRTHGHEERSWLVPADKKAFFILFLRELEDVKPPIVSLSYLIQVRQYIYQCERDKANMLLHRFCRLLMAEFDYTPTRMVEKDCSHQWRQPTQETTVFDKEEEVDERKLEKEVETFKHQILELWIEREQIPIHFEEYQEEIKQEFIWKFYQKLGENGLLSRLLRIMPMIDELTSSGHYGHVPQEDYVIAVIRLFFQFLINNHLRIERDPRHGEILQIEPEDQRLFDLEGKLPDAKVKIKGRVIHPAVSVFGRELLKPRLEIVSG